jgi:hypothetical protein
MMTAELTNTGRSFRRTWIVNNTVGLGIGMALFAAVAEGIEQSGIMGAPEIGDQVGHLIGLALAGVLFGLMQWLALRRHVARTGWAVPATSAGLTLGYILGYIMGGPPFDFILAPALAAGLGGLAQWVALRHAAGAGWWVPVSSVAFATGGIAGTAVAVLGLGDALGGSYLAWIALNGMVYLIAGALGGVISVSVLARLVRRAESVVGSVPVPARAQ